MAHFTYTSHAPFLVAALLLMVSTASAATVSLDWKVEFTNVTRLCHTKSLISVNGQFPGPTVVVHEGDTVIVNVTNLVSSNVTIHWHGVLQIHSAWADGPAYITQCPIQTGNSYVYRFRIINQRGTLLWHAHFSWLRATVHGAFIIHPKHKMLNPYITPKEEIPIILGEWWNANVEDVIAQALQIGGAYNISDALTINGQPGALYNCSLNDTQIIEVKKGTTYLLRIINAAVNFQMYVGVTNHTLTVVAVDAEYTEPYITDIVVLTPGQTTDVLLKADQEVGQYFLSASVFSPPNPAVVPFPTTPTTAIIRYHGASQVPSSNLALPAFPVFNDSAFVANFTHSLKGQQPNDPEFARYVPQTVDEHLFFTVGYALQPCSTCSSSFIPGNRLSASINNVTFNSPQKSLLQAYYNHINGVYETDFPSEPLFQYNYTGVTPTDTYSTLATEVKVLDFNKTVQLILQDTATLFFENHPIHLHGHNFFVVGTGVGTFNATTDTANFNLINPPSRNTIGVPAGGWAAIRFQTTNPGVWFMHCHFDLHTSWGMSMAFIVKNGKGLHQKLPSPPSDLPPC